MNDRPNILFLYADQHRADVLGCAGNGIVATPNLDRLASEGLLCTTAWTESPVCQPARASVLTGRYPTEHGVLGNFDHNCSPDWPTFPRALQASGYETASIGKTHYSSWPMGPQGPENSPPPADEWIARFGFDHVVEEFDRYVHTGRQDTPYMRFLRDHDALEPYQAAVQARFRMTDRHWEAATSPLPQELDLTSFLAGEAESWLGTRSGERPWFLQLSFVQPHVPLMGDPVWAGHYAQAQIPRTGPAAPQSDHRAWSTHLDHLRAHSHSELLSDEFVLSGARQYYAMVSLIDQKVGDLLDLLERRGELDNTLVVYAADHGEMLGDHALMAKMSFYRSSVRIPMIIRPAGGTSPLVHPGPVQAFDMVATMLDAAGTQLDEVPARSLLPVLGGGEHRDVAISMIRLRPQLPTWLAVTDGRARLTFDRDSGDVVEYFDLESDPDEEFNLAATAPVDEVERLRSLVRAELTPEG
ncbi:MAG: sulfatase-like hydrolase/transferase [Actinomycetia bacterium]|nr:sulfatase-like hydrolase/transferase [Actinomycetes bacterium]